MEIDGVGFVKTTKVLDLNICDAHSSEVLSTGAFIHFPSLQASIPRLVKLLCIMGNKNEVVG